MGRLNLKRKGVIFAIIILIISIDVIQLPGKSVVKNNIHKYSENSTICGFTTDFETGEPIEEADICFFINDPQGHHYDYETWSDENGYYIIENVVEGLCHEYGVWADGYHFYWGIKEFDIPENETVWVNMSMYPFQPETSKVCGYIYDDYTGEPIVNISVAIHWFDIHHIINYNGSLTDENGFYAINFGAGRFDLYTITEGYVDQGSNMYYSGDYELFWINFSLMPEVIIGILRPDKGLYINNEKILPFFYPIIIGPIDIEISLVLNGGNPVDNVEILIDNISKYNFTSEPYTYHWDEKTPFRFRYKIEVIAHREWDTDASRTLKVWKFF